ncbi:hypothetical protein [Marinobacter alexandrii]|uniref:hypothetical protein n=1 Tax=Marinobacter alexandrii TaxID=2570351 RepID=UPI001108AABA|nr:hypothetical protein [Marinobacter alexandrii]
MPTGNLPVNNYLGDGQRTTSEFQTGIDQLLAYANSLKAEVDALSAAVIKEAAVRGVGTGLTDLVETSQLDTRLATTGNLGTAATKNFGTGLNEVPEYREEIIEIGGADFDPSQFMKILKVGNLVTVTLLNDLTTHANKADPVFSGIPTWARPNDITRAVYNVTTAYLREIAILTDGSGKLTYYQRAATGLQSASNTGTAFTISYAI